MVKIRLTRIGKKHEPIYRVVVSKAKTKRDGEAIAFLGNYNPQTKLININKELAQEWLTKGAQPTKTAEYLLVKSNIIPKKAKQFKFADKPGKKASAKIAKLNKS